MKSKEERKKEIIEESYLELNQLIENIYFRRVKTLDKINELIQTYNLSKYVRFCESISSVEEFLNFTLSPEQQNIEVLGYLFAINTQQKYNSIKIYYNETKGFETSVKRSDFNGNEYKNLTEWNNVPGLIESIRGEFRRRIDYEKTQAQQISRIKSIIREWSEK